MISFTWLRNNLKFNMMMHSLIMKVVLIILGMICAILITIFFFNPLENKFEKRIIRYPTQWAQLTQLAKLMQSNEGNEFIPLLNQKEFEVLRTKLNSLGIAPNVFRLTNSNEPKIEIQINDVDFSTWLQLTEELRFKYHLYTDNATIQKGNEAGTVQISSTMVQKR